MRTIRCVVLCSFLCGSSAVALLSGTSAEAKDEPVIGTGRAAGARNFQEEKIGAIKTPRVTLPRVTGMLMTDPVTVKPRGSAAIVAGSAFINNKVVANSMVQVKCTLPGQKIWIAGNAFINNGLIVGTGGDTAMVMIKCQQPGPVSVDVHGNMLYLDGKMIN